MYQAGQGRNKVVQDLKTKRLATAERFMTEFFETVDDSLQPLNTPKADQLRKKLMDEVEYVRQLNRMIKEVEGSR